MSLFLLLVGEYCLFASGGDSKIVGGRNALRGEFPATVCIGGNGRCGGTLIAWDKVVSVAHCFLDHGVPLHPNTFTVIGGDINFKEETGEEQGSYIRDYIIHKNFEIVENELGYFTVYDVAVAYLESPFVQTDTVKRATFPASDSFGMQQVLKFIQNVGDTCVAVGFGSLVMESVEPVFSDTLKVAQLRILPNNECFVPPEMRDAEICATAINEPDRTAPGDSGSTFICGGYIIGMAKSGSIYSLHGKNVTHLVFTLIGPYIDYFELTLLVNGGSQSCPVISLVALQIALHTTKLAQFLFR